LFEVTNNLKHRVLLKTTYSAGLRLSTLIRKYGNVLFDIMRPVVSFVNYHNQKVLKGAYLNRPL